MEKLDLTVLLKDCPKGTKLYSPLVGEVTLYEITESVHYPIKVRDIENDIVEFTRCGQYFNCEYGECMLFPSKENRDWSTLKVPKSEPKYQFKPFDRVLARDIEDEDWQAHFYSHFDKRCNRHVCISSEYEFRYCIPYEGNEHLLGTTDTPKEE